MRVATPDINTKYPSGTVCAVWLDGELSISTTPNGYVTALQFENKQDCVDYGENVLNQLEEQNGEIVHADGDLVGQCIYCARWFIFAGARDNYHASKNGGYACTRCYEHHELPHVEVKAYIWKWACAECGHDNYETNNRDSISCERCGRRFTVKK